MLPKCRQATLARRSLALLAGSVALVLAVALPGALPGAQPATASPAPAATATASTTGSTTASPTGSMTSTADASALVSAVPAAWTPQVRDGNVRAFARVGQWIVAGGPFSSVSAADGSGVLSRPNIFAFDATTGAVSAAFAPRLDGEVDALAPGPDGSSVIVGGKFKHVNGVAARGVTRLALSTGKVASGWRTPTLDGNVADLVVSGGRVFLAGWFRHVDGAEHGGLATIDATTGALDPYLDAQVSEHHNYTGGPDQAVAPVGATALAVTPSGGTLVAIGNFKKVDGVLHDQIVRLSLGSSAAVVDGGWNTSRFGTACSPAKFDSWVRDVAFSPNGAYFVVVSTGGNHGGQLCDSAVRFTTATRGSDVDPAWIDRTGGDSLYSVVVGPTAVYTGGHQRWFNNPIGKDLPSSGAVPRPGIAAIDPASGLPLSWNPGRNPRGEGAKGLLLTADGLWVGSDTSCVGPSEPGNCVTYVRPRLAFFPAGGATPAATSATPLPNDVVSVGPWSGGGFGDTLSATAFSGTTATSDSAPPTDGAAWSSARGATRIGDRVFFAWSDGTFQMRTFDGATWGPDQVMDPYEDPVWSDIRTGSDDANHNPVYYKGVPPTFYAEIPDVTSLFYWGGRLYYTLSTSSQLHWRLFAPDTGTIGQHESLRTVSGFDATAVAGAFLAGGTFYWANAADGTLHAMRFSGGVPVSGTDRQLTGTGVGDRDWRARGLFVAPTAAPPPTHVTVSLAGPHPVLGWASPKTADSADVVVRREPGTVPPATTSDGDLVYQGPATSFTDTVTLGATYSYSFWTVTAEGSRSAPVQRTMTALGTPVVSTPALASSVSASATWPVTWRMYAGPAPAGFDVRWAGSGGGSGTWLAGTTATSASFGASRRPLAPVPGSTYTFTLTARDSYGNSSVPAQRRTTVPLNETAATAVTGGWSSASPSGAWLGTVRRTSAANQRLVLSLSGTQLLVIGTRAPGHGQFKVYVDGAYAGTVGTWASSTRMRQVLWRSAALAPGTHRLGIWTLGSSGHPAITIDGFAGIPAG